MVYAKPLRSLSSSCDKTMVLQTVFSRFFCGISGTRADYGAESFTDERTRRETHLVLYPGGSHKGGDGKELRGRVVVPIKHPRH
jgi:hypothetical protein